MKNKNKCFKDKNNAKQSIYFIFKFFIRLFNDLAFLPWEEPFSAAFTRPLNCPSNLAFFRRLRELFCNGTYAYGSGLFFRFISVKEKNVDITNIPSNQNPTSCSTSFGFCCLIFRAIFKDVLLAISIQRPVNS